MNDTTAPPLQVRLDLALESAPPEARLVLDGREIAAEAPIRGDGLEARILPFAGGRLLALHDTETSASMFWLAFPAASAPSRLEVETRTGRPLAAIPHALSCEGFACNGRLLEFRRSRTLQMDRSRCAASGWSVDLSLVRPGPAHLAWLVHPQEDGPLQRFKDVGTEETGGIKFRFDEYGYVLYTLDSDALSRAPWRDPSRPPAEHVVLRYLRRELDVLWEITGRSMTRHG